MVLRPVPKAALHNEWCQLSCLDWISRHGDNCFRTKSLAFRIVPAIGGLSCCIANNNKWEATWMIASWSFVFLFLMLLSVYAAVDRNRDTAKCYAKASLVWSTVGLVTGLTISIIFTIHAVLEPSWKETMLSSILAYALGPIQLTLFTVFNGRCTFRDPLCFQKY